MGVITRPAGGYTPANPITNSTKYQDDRNNGIKVSSVKVDGDINKAFDILTDHDNTLSDHETRIDVLDNPVANATEATVAAEDTILFADASDGNSLRRDTVQGIIDLTMFIPVGIITPFAGASSPSGWLMCYGQAVNRVTYSGLFDVIGTTYGSGDGSTTFNLPDLKGRTTAGVDNMGGVAANRVTNAISGIDGTTLGASGGDQRMHQHTHGTSENPHRHGQQHPSGSPAPSVQAGASGAVKSGLYIGSGASAATQNQLETDVAVTNLTINNAGAGGSQNMQPTIMMNYIIKT